MVDIFSRIAVVAQPFNLVLMVVGIVLGVIVGVLPGLGGANGVAILLPLTFSMSPTSAIIMLSCIYWGAFSAAPSPRSYLIYRASHGPWPRPSTAIRWRRTAGRRSADRRIYVVLRRRAVRRHYDHAGGAMVASFALNSDRRKSSRSTSSPSAASSASPRVAVQDRRIDDARLRPGRGRPRPDDRPTAPDLRRRDRCSTMASTSSSR